MRTGLFTLVLALVIPFCAVADDQPARIRVSDLDNVVGTKRYYRNVSPYDPRIPSGALDRRIAPGARIKESYSLSGKGHLPIRLYYDEKLLAEIVE